jgi:hypothetical protein
MNLRRILSSMFHRTQPLLLRIVPPSLLHLVKLKVRAREKPLNTEHRWLRMPGSLSGKKVCLLACYSPIGALSLHTLLLAKTWSQQGFAVILIVAKNDLEPLPHLVDELVHLEGILLRFNSGYDFGSWATALIARPDLREAALLVTTNDSVYGPLDGFPAMLDRMSKSPSDVIGMVDCFEHEYHMQSFLVFYRPRALQSRVFSRFWKSIRDFDRRAAIDNAELTQWAFMHGEGLEIDILFPTPAEPILNPTLSRWRELIGSGFPFIKVELLRTNPRGANLMGWNAVLTDHGFDPEIVRQHLGPLFNGSPAASAWSVAPRPS